MDRHDDAHGRCNLLVGPASAHALQRLDSETEPPGSFLDAVLRHYPFNVDAALLRPSKAALSPA